MGRVWPLAEDDEVCSLTLLMMDQDMEQALCGLSTVEVKSASEKSDKRCLGGCSRREAAFAGTAPIKPAYNVGLNVFVFFWHRSQLLYLSHQSPNVYHKISRTLCCGCLRDTFVHKLASNRYALVWASKH
jgi:hypothetical protein